MKMKCDSNSVEVEKQTDIETQILKAGSSGTILPINCDFCNDNHPSTHVCCFPVGNRRIENKEDNICGLATCFVCANGDENRRSRCKFHVEIEEGEMLCLPCNDENNNQTRKSGSSPYPIYTPDYFYTYTSIQALGFDFDNFPFPGFQLLHLRVKKEIEAKGQNKVNQYIKDKTHRCKRDKALPLRCKVPFRESQKRKPFQDISNQPSNIINQTSTTSNQSSVASIYQSSESTTNTRDNQSSTSNNNSSQKSSTTTETTSKQWKRGPRQKCLFINCTYTERTATMSRIITIPKKVPNFNSSKCRDVVKYLKRKLERAHVLKNARKRIKEVFIFSVHIMIWKRLKKSTHMEGMESQRLFHLTFNAPVGAGMGLQAIPTTQSRGSANNRAFCQNIGGINDQITHLTTADSGNNNQTLAVAASTNASLVMDSYEIIDKQQAKIDELVRQNKEFRASIEALQREVAPTKSEHQLLPSKD